MKNPLSPRPEIEKMPIVHHGAFDFAELEKHGFRADDLLDFSMNSNPFYESARVWEVIKGLDLAHYPDRESLAIRRFLVKRLRVATEQVLVGSGTSELLSLLAQAYIRPKDLAVILAPTYGEYSRTVEIMGGEVEFLWAEEGNDFQHNESVVSTYLLEKSPRMIFICNPNNPTGTIISLETLKKWVEIAPETLFVIDEAYLDFTPNLPSAFSLGAPNLLVLASMTKNYALAGLRLGYALGDKNVIDALARVRPPWNVNALAQEAGLAVLKDDAYLRKTLAQLEKAKNTLFTELRTMGFHLIPSQTHYALIKVGDAANFRAKLLQKGIQVRDCASFGLPKYIRIAAKTPKDNEQLITALKM